MAPRSRILIRRRVLALLALVVAAVIGLLATNYRALVSSYVTWKALAAVKGAAPASGDEFVELCDDISARFDPWFAGNYLDRAMILRAFPARGLVAEAWPPLIVYAAYARTLAALRPDQSERDLAFREYVAWLDPLAADPKGLEILVGVLIGDHEIPASWWDQGLAKKILGSMLFSLEVESELDVLDRDRDVLEWRARCLGAVEERHWDRLRARLAHPRERVRAGAILLLRLQPSRELFVREAMRALHDPSALVRLAAAGSLALLGEPAGRVELIRGTASDRWEIRWWSAATLSVLGRELDLLPLALALASESDRWVRDEIEKGLRSVWRAQAETRQLRAALDRSASRVLRACLPGRIPDSILDRIRRTRGAGGGRAAWLFWLVRVLP